MRRIRGDRISMIFQEPMTSLNPVLSVGRQIAECVQLHQGLGRAAAMQRAVEMLKLVQIPEAERRADEYPHQLSGGMRQRVMIAMALSCKPELLIADEPTTALDVTIQAQILDLIKRLQRELGMGVILITHDLGVVAESCDRVVVMYAGRKVEEATVLDLFDRPRHPYTRALMASMPALSTARRAPRRDPGHGAGAAPARPRLRLRAALHLRRRRAAVPSSRRSSPTARGHGVACFAAEEGRIPERACRSSRCAMSAARRCSRSRSCASTTSRPSRWLGPARPPIQAVDDVSFTVERGETLALVGESGCGKTTTAKSVVRLIEPTSGSVQLEGEELTTLSAEQMRQRRKDLQIVFQDPYASLDPRLPAGDIVAEPLRNFAGMTAAERRERVQWLFARVGLRPESAAKYPHEFSGGQRQRLGIARALALNPKLIVCDEPVSALDVSVQAQVVNLLMDLQAELGIAYLFVAHDLAVVRHISHRVAVMYLGQMVEVADRDTLFAAPRHPYTEILLVGRAGAEPAHQAAAHAAAGRPAEPRQPAAGLPLPHPLPAGAAGLPRGAAAAHAARRAGAGTQWVACHFR